MYGNRATKCLVDNLEGFIQVAFEDMERKDNERKVASTFGA